MQEEPPAGLCGLSILGACGHQWLCSDDTRVSTFKQQLAAFLTITNIYEHLPLHIYTHSFCDKGILLHRCVIVPIGQCFASSAHKRICTYYTTFLHRYTATQPPTTQHRHKVEIRRDDTCSESCGRVLPTDYTSEIPKQRGRRKWSRPRRHLSPGGQPPLAARRSSNII
jgi:hypothetical protein